MRIELGWPDSIRVVAATDYKGNPVTILLVDDMEVLYAAGHEPDGLSPEAWTDVFRTRITQLLARLLLANLDDQDTWGAESPTGRETWGAANRAVRLAEESNPVRLRPRPGH